MKPLEEARSQVLAAVSPLEAETVSIWEAGGRILARDVVAPEDVPPFPNSAMDGFAIRSGDTSTPGAVLDVVGELAAGYTTDLVVGPGEALKIMTGAPLPVGADAVVKVEDTSVEGSKVTVRTAVNEGTAVRPAGGDVSAGQLVFTAGTRLTPMHVGVLATIGVGSPWVSRRPRVAFMSTGDELTPPETERLPLGRIRDSNRPMLRALLEEAGVVVQDLGVVPDDPDELRLALQRGADGDLIVSTGGVSMGEYDVTKVLLEGGGEVEFWQVAIQPAKPFAFGRIGGTLFFGLPGNPVSVLVSFEQLLRPALLAMQGARALLRPRLTGRAGEAFDTDPAKTVFLRVRLEGVESGVPVAYSSGGQSSNVLSAAANADAFAVVPRGTARVEAGEPLTLEMFRWAESREWSDGL